ncbi:hypothetical protein OROHE_018695 [Orobanche hederae]
MTPALSWIKADETAKEALVRILTERPSVVLPPPLHRMSLRVGNVVEIAGPSPSAKTLILIQAAINCILPKEWKGVRYGGLQRTVFFIDLDCRFDVFSISRALEKRIIRANGLLRGGTMKRNTNEYDKELFVACMRRFMYTRCYNSFEFLATLKTLHSLELFIGWIVLCHLHQRRATTGKILSLQTMTESIVQEIQTLLLLHPMLVLAAKSDTFGDKQSAAGVKRNSGKWTNERSHRDYMPSAWQSFVSHRVLLRPSDGESKHHNHPTFFTEWLLPRLRFSDRFTINNDGLLVIL